MRSEKEIRKKLEHLKARLECARGGYSLASEITEGINLLKWILEEKTDAAKKKAGN